MKNKKVVIILGMILLILVGSYGITNNTETFKLLSDKRKNAKRIGTNMMASDCQNKCAKLRNCKYIQRPRNLELWDKGDCYMTDDDFQYKVGDPDGGIMRTWRNKNYVAPKPPVYVPPSEYGGSSNNYVFSNRGQAKKYCEQQQDNKGRKLSLCHSDQVREYKDGQENICDSGWTTDRRGWWVGRYRGSGCGACGNHAQYWNGWHRSRSSAHCCANMVK
tara:strand:+ start:1392 stop:2048 length:657 start_codon:yes stop_codon:yes gene_type:complete